jgi:hypothetical protein
MQRDVKDMSYYKNPDDSALMNEGYRRAGLPVDAAMAALRENP